jgi:ABC-type Mn2+/Zn2+ transport system permease subunit
MATRPEDRYGSVRALAADVESWLAGEPVSAWREPPWTRLDRWARRHRTGTAVAAATILVALAAVTIALSMRIVGILLIAALMVLPVIAASRIAWSMRSTILLGMGIGLGSVLAGITIAYYADLPPGGTTVLVAAATVLVAECWSVLRD